MVGEDEEQDDLFAEQVPPTPAEVSYGRRGEQEQHPPGGQSQHGPTYQLHHPYLGQAPYQPAPYVQASGHQTGPGGTGGYGEQQLVAAPRQAREGSWSQQDMVDMVVKSMSMVQNVGENKKRKVGVDDHDEEEDLVKVRFENLTIEDDGENSISWEARSLRPYTGPLEKFWAKQPRVARPLRESFDTTFLRMDPVNGSVTLRDHDRGAQRTIKQYAKVNVRVTKTKAVISTSGFETHDVGLSKDFTECTGVYQIVSALWQYTTNLWMIRRDDYSGLLMLQVLHDVKFMLPVIIPRFPDKTRREEKQLEVLKYFIDEAFASNSQRGRAGKPPMQYEDYMRLVRSAAGKVFGGAGVAFALDAGNSPVEPYSGTAGPAMGSEYGPRGGRRGGLGRGGAVRGGAGGGVQVGASDTSGAAPAQVVFCRDWNNHKCTYGNKCKFQHKCDKVLPGGGFCGKNHKAAQTH